MKTIEKSKFYYVSEKTFNSWLLLLKRLLEFRNNPKPLNCPSFEYWLMLLNRNYGQEHRAYHNWAHIEFCLDEFRRTAHLCSNPLAVELAIWFHDAIYDVPPDPDLSNELRSAGQAESFLAAHEIYDETLLATVKECILATEHNVKNRHKLDVNIPLICDIDLAILGQPDRDYKIYAMNIREENILMPLEKYRRERAKFIKSLLNLDTIFQIHSFIDAYESRARINLSRELAMIEESKTFPPF